MCSFRRSRSTATAKPIPSTAGRWGSPTATAMSIRAGCLSKPGCAARPVIALRLARRLNEIRAAREATQPVRARTGGSTFKNPPGDSAWRLIDAAGCRGLVRGGAMVSQQHTNFLINTGTATAADLEGLGEEVRRRVHDTSGIWLEWEIERIGSPASRHAAHGFVIPAKAGIQRSRRFGRSPPCSSQGQALGPRFRGGDGMTTRGDGDQDRSGGDGRVVA